MPVNIEKLKSFIAREGGPWVSIFFPLSSSSDKVQQSVIRLKNGLREAKQQLAQHDQKGRDHDELLEPGWRLVKDFDFWQEADEGLALFLSRGSVEHIWTPEPLEELTVVADRPIIKPLLPMLDEDTDFYVLALSPKQVRLVEADRGHAREVSLEGKAPRSITEALGPEVGEKPRLQGHTRSPRGPGGRPSMAYHGMGEEDSSPEIERFLRQVDAGVSGELTDGAPVVLAGNERIINTYRRISELPAIQGEALVGAPDELGITELRQRAWPLVRPRLVERRQQDLGRFQDLASGSEAVTDLRELFPAAFEGRVETLFVAVDEQLWGHYQGESDRFELTNGPDDGAHDLLDDLTAMSLTRGAAVHGLPRTQMPHGQLAAAILRYS